MNYLPELEVQYNVNPTVLFEYIDRSDWVGATERARAVPVEARTWLINRVGSRVEWRYLPLHLSLQFNPTYQVIEALLRVYPDAVRRQDHDERLPLHVYCHANSLPTLDPQDIEGIVHLLLKAYPESLHIRDETGLTPLQIIETIEAQKGPSIRTTVIKKALCGALGISIKPGIIPERNSQKVIPDVEDAMTLSTAGSSFEDRPMLRNVVKELEDALAQAQQDQINAKDEVTHLRQENSMCLNLIKKLKAKLTEFMSTTDEDLVRQFEQRIQETNKDLEECRGKLKIQVVKFEKEILSLTAANEAAIRDLKMESVEKDQEMERKTKGLIAVNKKLSERIETLESQLGEDQSTISLLQNAMAKERSALRDEAVRMDHERCLWEEEKEELVKSVKFLKQGMSEQANITKTAFGRRVEEMESLISEKENKMTELNQQLHAREEAITQLTSQLKDKNELEAKTKELKSVVDEKAQEIARLRENAQKALQMTSNDFQSKKKGLEDQIVHQQKIIDEKSKEITELKDAMRKTMAKLETSKKIYSELKDKSETEGKIRSTLEDEIRTLRDKLKDKISMIQRISDEKSAEAHAIIPKVTLLEREVEELGRKLQDAEQKRQKLKETISQNNDTFREKAKTLSKAKKELTQEKERLERKVKSLAIRSEALERESKEYKQILCSESRATYKRLSAEASGNGLENKIDEAQKKISSLTAENKKLREVLSMTGKFSSENASRIEHDIGYENLKLQVIRLETEIEMLRKQLGEKETVKAHGVFMAANLNKLEQENVALKLTVEHLEEALAISKTRSSESFGLMSLSRASKDSKSNDERLNSLIAELKKENRELSEKVHELTKQKAVVEAKHSSCDDQIKSLTKRNDELQLKADQLNDKIEANTKEHYEKIKELSEQKQQIEKESFANQMKLEQTRKVLDSTIKLQQEMEGYSSRDNYERDEQDIHQGSNYRESLYGSSQENSGSYYNGGSMDNVHHQLTGDSSLYEDGRYHGYINYRQFTQQESRDDYQHELNESPRNNHLDVLGSSRHQLPERNPPHHSRGGGHQKYHIQQQSQTRSDRWSNPRGNDGWKYGGTTQSHLHDSATISSNAAIKGSPKNSVQFKGVALDGPHPTQRQTTGPKSSPRPSGHVLLQDSSDEESAGIESIFNNLEAVGKKCFVPSLK